MSSSTREAAAAIQLEVRSTPLGGSALARAAMAGRVPPAWYPISPRNVADWRRHAQQVRADDSARRSVERLLPAFDATGAAAERLGRVRTGGGIMVTTGQQPGLFGGPIYTWSKALSALALADELERVMGVPVAPVFWAATDDADFAEASVTYVAVPGGLETIRLPAPAAEGVPMAEVPLPEVQALVGTLVGGAGSSLYPAPLVAAAECYAAGRTVGAAYVALLRRILEPLGIVVLDASHAAVREAADPLVRRALEKSRSMSAALEARAAELERRGFAPQVHDRADQSLVFARDGARKVRVSLAQASEVAASASVGSLTPNVLLRPTVERALLPTVAYLAGPGELAYFAQASAVAAALEVAPLCAVPRWSVTIIEPHVRRILDRLGLTPDALADPHAPERQLAHQRIPPAVIEALRATRQQLDVSLAKLGESARATPLLLPTPVLRGAERAIAHRLDRLERRIRAAAARQAADAMHDLATARAALFPNGVRQERALNFLPLLARHGPPLLDRMRAAAATHAASLVAGAPAPDGDSTHRTDARDITVG